jgi:hypothetical protein
MNPIWRGALVQMWMSTCMLIVTMTALLIRTESGIVQILCGAMATAYGAMMMRAKIDAGSNDGGGYTGGQSMRAPRIVDATPPPQIKAQAQTRLALGAGLAAVAAVLLLTR